MARPRLAQTKRALMVARAVSMLVALLALGGSLAFLPLAPPKTIQRQRPGQVWQASKDKLTAPVLAQVLFLPTAAQAGSGAIRWGDFLLEELFIFLVVVVLVQVWRGNNWQVGLQLLMFTTLMVDLTELHLFSWQDLEHMELVPLGLGMLALLREVFLCGLSFVFAIWVGCLTVSPEVRGPKMNAPLFVVSYVFIFLFAFHPHRAEWLDWLQGPEAYGPLPEPVRSLPAPEGPSFVGPLLKPVLVEFLPDWQVPYFKYLKLVVPYIPLHLVIGSLP